MRIEAQDAKAWAEPSKFPTLSLDEDHLNALETEIFARLNAVYDTTAWTDPDTTPAIVKVIISKLYVSWKYKQSFAEDLDQGNRYAYELEDNANMLMTGLIDGTIDIPGEVPINVTGSPSFYPTDASSAQEPTYYDSSLGPAQFSMGRVF
jgi:hypothetical protein